MFFNKRRKWNGEVAGLLPTFGLSIEVVGPFAALEALDIVFPKGYSPHEGALYLAYLSYSTFVKEGDERASVLLDRITFAENDWLQAGRVGEKLVNGWRKKAREWEAASLTR